MPVKMTMIDNYDSFTYNLVQYLEELGAQVTIYRNDDTRLQQVSQLGDGIVISPGPGNPDQAGMTLGVIEQAARQAIPTLGVCLGHQAIAQYFGAQIIRSTPSHGKVEMVHTTQSGLFASLPQQLQVTRYHSLCVAEEGLPQELEVTARLADGTIMGFAHRSLPFFGVQFHPEAMMTEYGKPLLASFLQLTQPEASAHQVEGAT